MSAYLLFALLGLGAGAVYSAFGIGLILVYRASGVINFAYAATAMASTYVYAELEQDGKLDVPIVGIPTAQLSTGPTNRLVAAAIAVLFAVLLGLILHLIVYRPLRTSPALAKAVASVGVMISLEAMAVIRYTSTAVAVAPVLPNKPVKLLGSALPRDRLWLALIVALLGIVLWAVFKYTRFGWITRAVAENERGAAVLGYSPSRIAALNWVISSVIAAGIGILIAPIVSLNATSFTLLIVPALGVALVARFRSFGLCVVVGLALGAIQSMLDKVQADFSWFPKTDVQDGIPFLLIIVVMAVAGSVLPDRSGASTDRVVRSPMPERVWTKLAAVGAIFALGLVLLNGDWKLAIISTLTTAILCLSLVALTGFVGQVSLAQMAFAGIAGFSVSKLAVSAGIPFPFSPILAAMVACLFGVLVGIPALRVRGVNLAIITLAASEAISSFVFTNNWFTGGYHGSRIKQPSIFGLNLGIANGNNYPRAIFGFMALILVLLIVAGLANLRRSATGRRMLAVRSNERAAAAAGLNVAATKLAAFALSAFIAGIGGVMIAYSYPGGNLSTDSFGVFASLTTLALAYLGGIGRAWGGLVGGALGTGAVVFYGLSQVFHSFQTYEVLIGGLGLVVTVVLNPEGLTGIASLVRQQISGRRRSGTPTDQVEDDVLSVSVPRANHEANV
jgi:ABC-type branched-subunit amino acid transport system permease subunit